MPFLHAFYRLHRFQPGHQEVILLHFDGHPDLSLPSGPPRRTSVDQWKDPHTLYDLLAEGEGGIAEFILPLFTTHLLQEMVWIRPSWSHQLPDGPVVFDLFEEDGQARVNWACAYYLDNQDFAYPSSSSTFLTKVPLTVSEVNAMDTERWRPLSVKEKDLLWILDICLDYFLTNNPFLVEAKHLIANDLATIDNKVGVEEALARVCQAVESLRYRQGPSVLFPLEEESNKKANKKRKLMRDERDLLQEREEAVSAITNLLLLPVTHTPSVEEVDALCALYEDRKIARDFLEILPSFSQQTRQYIADNLLLLLLPHELLCTQSRDSIETRRTVLKESINRMKTFLSDWSDRMAYLTQGRSKYPLFVSICRSSEDPSSASIHGGEGESVLDNGYTPIEEVDWLQGEVEKMIREVFAPGVGSLRLVNLCEEAVEESQRYLADRRAEKYHQKLSDVCS